MKNWLFLAKRCKPLPEDLFNKSRRKYCKEWIRRENLDEKSKFSIQRTFNRLKNGQKKEVSCSGFQFTAVLDREEECFVIINNKEIPFEQISGIRLEKKDSSAMLWWLFAGVIILWSLTWILITALIDSGQSGMGRGEFGDMFGSINALFSGLALGGIIYTINLQKRELKLQRRELRDTRKEFEIQNETLKLQRFENTFFQMVNLHHDIVDKIGKDKIDALADRLLENQKFPYSGHDEITLPNVKKNLSEEQALNYLQAGYQKFYFTDGFEKFLSNYFRNLYHIFKFIYQTDQIDPAKKRFYSSIVRAQLGQKELYLIFYNSLLPNLGNPKFIFLIKEFQLMDNFNKVTVQDFKYHWDFFERICAKVTNQLDVENAESISPL